MEYKTIKEFYNSEFQELQMSGITDTKISSFIEKYEEMLKLYRKLHPIKFILIRILPFLGNRF